MHKETKPFSMSVRSTGQRQGTVCLPAVAEVCRWRALHWSMQCSRAGLGAQQPLRQVGCLSGLSLKQSWARERALHYPSNTGQPLLSLWKFCLLADVCYLNTTEQPQPRFISYQQFSVTIQNMNTMKFFSKIWKHSYYGNMQYSVRIFLLR